MRQELVKYALTEVPRYTSYPTAAQFHDAIGEEDYRKWLATITEDTRISLYVHVPFCQQMCWYCGCHTTVVSGYDRIGRYLETVRQELRLLADAIPEKGRITHVHFGGGSPTLLAEKDFSALMADIRALFPLAADAEVAIEIDPPTLDEAKTANLAAAGVTRASLGVQDFSPHVQARINRIQPYYVVDRAVKWLRQAGVGAINFDIMYGLPAQRVSDVIHTVSLALSLSPDRLAVFGYAHVPWFKKHQRMIREEELPGAAERYEQAEAAARAMTERGYVEVGFDHYARPGDPMAEAVKAGTLRRNFQGYTVDNADILLGLGASSIGSLSAGYVQNAPALDIYRKHVEAGHLPIVRGVALSAEDRLRRAAIERVMTQLSLDVGEICREFGQAEDALDSALAAMALLEADGLLTLSGRQLTVSPEGRRFLRNIAACFDAYWKPSPSRHSRAV